MRTMDAFWSGQLQSKEWLIDALELQYSVKDNPITIEIHGGWVGVLASMLFQSTVPIKKITSIDIDYSVEAISILMNKKEEMEGRYQALTEDMCNVISSVDLVINTSCEHITQRQYEIWLGNRNKNQLLVLQSNNYEIDEHIRISRSLEEFKQQSCLSEVLWTGELRLPLYTRFMIVGRK
jgi:hypothetical protein